MDAQDFRSLQEAYLEVVENQQLDELTPATPRNIERLVDKREKDAKRAEDRRGNNSTPEYKKYFRTLQRQKVRSMFDRPASRSVEPASTNEETDLYDIILSHLLDEGYAETPEAAEAIMVNMSEDWKSAIKKTAKGTLDVVGSAARGMVGKETTSTNPLSKVANAAGRHASKSKTAKNIKRFAKKATLGVVTGGLVG